MVQIINPLTIVNTGGGGGSEPGGNIQITAYDTTTGVISGGGFGSTAGTVYVLDRDTNTYVAQTVSSWGPASITLSTPVDLTTLEGTTSMAVVADDGTWSNKWLLTGDVAVSGWGKLYVQNPDTRAIYTVAVTSQTDFEKLYGASNGWSRQVVIGADTFYTDEIVGFQFGSSFNLTTLDDFFLAYCANITQPIVIPFGVTSIGTNFLQDGYSFNQPIIIPSGVTTLGKNFLRSCDTFNQPILLPSTVTAIDNFLYDCRAFNQPLDLSFITSFGDYFLGQCSNFNQPLIIPSGVSALKNFLFACYSFNQPLIIPDGVTDLTGFLSTCYTFNQPLTIPSSVTTLGNAFMSNCRSFNRPLIIPSGVTAIGTYFLQNAYSFSDLTVNTTTSPTDNNSLSTNQSTAKMYVKGITIKGPGRSTWISGLPDRTSSPYRKLINGGE